MGHQKQLPLPQAAGLALAKFGRPTLTAYLLGVLVFDLYVKGEIEGQQLRVKNPRPERRHFTQVLDFFLSHGVLREVRDFPSRSVFSVIGQHDSIATELICTADPFAYVSHMSAMEIHGLTDRLPQTLFISTPPSTQWRQFADEQMQKDLGAELENYEASGFPRLLRTRVDKVLGHPIHVMHSLHLGAFKKMDPQGVRVSTIGRTFLDMLRDPDLCGGIHHVLDVYRAHAKRFFGLIVAEVDQHGNDIDKVRAGYVLEELCELDSESIRAWNRFAKRGGSRKLVAKSPYASTYSERWCLSLNAD